MILLAWAIFWLSFYMPGYYQAYVVSYTVQSATLPNNVLAWARLSEGRVEIDMGKINDEYFLGPWDKSVHTACTIVHEVEHLKAMNASEVSPRLEEYRCYQVFMEAVWRTPGIEYLASVAKEAHRKALEGGSR